MSVRLVVSVVFTVVLLAAVTPAVEDARHARGSAAAERAAATVLDAADALVEAGEPPPAGIAGARRTLHIRLPDGAALVLVDGQRVLELYVDGRRTQTRALPAPAHLSDRTHRLRGRVVLTISYERHNGIPMLVFTRGFKPEGAAKKGHVTGRTRLSTNSRTDHRRSSLQMSNADDGGRAPGRRLGLSRTGRSGP